MSTLGSYTVLVQIHSRYVRVCAVCDGESEMYCENGQCVRLSYICDGDRDCCDASDERHCHLSTTTTPAAAGK